MPPLSGREHRLRRFRRELFHSLVIVDVFYSVVPLPLHLICNFNLVILYVEEEPGEHRAPS